MADYTPEQVQHIIGEKLLSAICSDAIKEVIKILHHQAQQEEVYSAYNPSQHNRRYNMGGLMDDSNLEWDVKLDSNDITLLMKNITNPINDKLSSNDLIRIIETGIGYDWDNSKIYQQMPYPRPFIQRTRELIQENRENFILLLKQELIKRGLNVI